MAGTVGLACGPRADLRVRSSRADPRHGGQIAASRPPSWGGRTEQSEFLLTSPILLHGFPIEFRASVLSYGAHAEAGNENLSYLTFCDDRLWPSRVFFWVLKKTLSLVRAAAYRLPQYRYKPTG